MKDTTAARIQGGVLGCTLTLVGSAALLQFVISPQTTAVIQTVSTQARNAQQQTDDAACRKMILESVRPAAGFTALYESAPAQQASALQLFDAIRPGLGTLLAKLQTPPTRPLAVRWVVPGRVTPAPVNSNDSYCWLNARGEVDAAHCPALAPATEGNVSTQ